MRARWVGLVALLSLLVVQPAAADVGPEDYDRPYRMDVTKDRGPGHTIWSRITFPSREGGDGWDPRGRVAYGCNSVELVVRNRVVGRLVEERYGDTGKVGSPLYSFMDSPGYATGSDSPCSDIGTLPGVTIPATEAEHAISPSFCEPSTAHGHIITFHGPGQMTFDTPLIPHREFNLRQGDPEFVGPNESCWFRGDEPGELMLWYRNADTGDYGIVARLSCAGLRRGWTCSDTVVMD